MKASRAAPNVQTRASPGKKKRRGEGEQSARSARASPSAKKANQLKAFARAA